jgi:hypothetical protein
MTALLPLSNTPSAIHRQPRGIVWVYLDFCSPGNESIQAYVLAVSSTAKRNTVPKRLCLHDLEQINAIQYSTACAAYGKSRVLLVKFASASAVQYVAFLMNPN